MAKQLRMRLTEAAVARLRPREREYTVWDTRVAGLGVRVRPSGGASFVFLRKVQGRTKRLSLGPVGANGLDDLRRRCHALMAESESESDSTSTTAPEAPLFRDFVSGPWKEAHFPRYKPSTHKGYRCSLVNQLLPAFGSTPLNHITRGQVLRWFDGYSQTAPGGANYALRLLRQILNFAIACGHVDANPVRAIRPNRRNTLTRFLSRDELRRLHRVLDEHARRGSGRRQQVDIIRLLLLTGCRKGEILYLRWSEVHEDALLLSDTKTGPANGSPQRTGTSCPGPPASRSERVRVSLPAQRRATARPRRSALVHTASRRRDRGCAHSRPAPHRGESCRDERCARARCRAAPRSR